MRPWVLLRLVTVLLQQVNLHCPAAAGIIDILQARLALEISNCREASSRDQQLPYRDCNCCIGTVANLSNNQGHRTTKGIVYIISLLSMMIFVC